MPTAVHREQQAYIRRMLEKRSRVTSERNGKVTAMIARDTESKADYAAMIAAMIADEEADDDNSATG